MSILYDLDNLTVAEAIEYLQKYPMDSKLVVDEELSFGLGGAGYDVVLNIEKAKK